MRDVNRIDGMLKRIGEIWKEYPDLRLGQLLCNVVDETYLYYIEDKDLLRRIEEAYGPDEQ